MSTLHQQILQKIHYSPVAKTSHTLSYVGTPRDSYFLTVPEMRRISKLWIQEHPALTLPQLIEVLDGLYTGKSFDERIIAGQILGYLPKLRKDILPKQLEKWLGNLEGWCEVDSTCQNVFTYTEMLENWSEWEKFLKRLSTDKNINKRRASLVLLTGPVTYSEDERLAELSFATIEKLQSEKDILITKAISWLLRSLITNHRQRVAQYLKENTTTLPKIALRETTKKLETGKK